MLWDKKDKSNVNSMNSADRHEAIKRLEHERKKVNAEIESILKSYAKESGNKALLPKWHGFGAAPNDWAYSEED